MKRDPIIEDIRHFRESKAAQYGYDAEVAMKDFVRLHKVLMKTRKLLPSTMVKPETIEVGPTTVRRFPQTD